jgi:beta-N-acetylglucosaminidase
MLKFKPKEGKLSAYEIWKISKKKNLSKEEYKQLLIENGIIIPKKK